MAYKKGTQAWSSNLRKYVIVAVIFFIFYSFVISPLRNSSGQQRLSQFGKDKGDIDQLPDDVDYHLKDIKLSNLSPNILQQNQQQQKEEDILQRQSVFDSTMFSSSTNDDPLKPITAILLRKANDEQAIEHLILQLLRYPFFREIFIYNTITSRPINERSFADKNVDNIKLHIINVSKNERLDTLSRYTLCASVASYDHCYFQDDDVGIYDGKNIDDTALGNPVNTYWDTLYVNFLRYPSLIHANVQPSRFIDHYRWRFYNQGIKMHAGFVDLAFGAIVPKWKVQHFLTQLGKSGLGKDRIYEADAYFSIWSNQYPWLLDNPLQNSSPTDGLISTTTSDSDNDVSTFEKVMWPSPHIGDTRRMIYDAARRLHRTLLSDLTANPKDYMDRIEEMPPMHQRDTRASCINDRCLFISNIDPIPSEQLDMIPAFDKAKYTNPKDWDNVLDEYLDLPNSDTWIDEGYHNAVDQRNDTCWNTRSNPQVNDYFGLITLGNGLPSQVVITTSTSVPAMTPTNQLFKVSRLENKNDWLECNILHHSTSANPTNNIEKTIITDIRLDIDCNYEENDQQDKQYIHDAIHALKITFLQNWKQSFSLCGMSINSLTI
ncbi:uncharacterized protein BX664DRAFT_289265 [Halteromyces radiatus]|uniref:uncharacterized protein n=1 Tax=Halteromyces radiatus TaxID=101107 RepID=UPI00221EE11D|nr:uncharacterized protein BX664DRAFT_289265 [Halteromyces radiatus]KAI8099257.1 hypothetical protein BX664DRAFT_289265 [Halteromyces radiatus]